MTAARQAVYDLVQRIPPGKVMTYGQIAQACGITNPRHVGSYLHQNPDPMITPCHRVVNAKGELAGAFAFGGPHIQRKLLEAEGVMFVREKVDLKKCLWENKT